MSEIYTEEWIELNAGRIFNEDVLDIPMTKWQLGRVKDFIRSLIKEIKEDKLPRRHYNDYK